MNVLILDKGILVDGLNNVSEQNLGGQRVSMVNDGFSIWAVPTVNCGLRLTLVNTPNQNKNKKIQTNEKGVR